MPDNQTRYHEENQRHLRNQDLTHTWQSKKPVGPRQPIRVGAVLEEVTADHRGQSNQKPDGTGLEVGHSATGIDRKSECQSGQCRSPEVKIGEQQPESDSAAHNTGPSALMKAPRQRAPVEKQQWQRYRRIHDTKERIDLRIRLQQFSASAGDQPRECVHMPFEWTSTQGTGVEHAQNSEPAGNPRRRNVKSKQQIESDA